MSFNRILLSRKCLWSSIAAHALSSQNPYMKQITMFIVWKHKRCHYKPSQATVTMTTAEREVLVWAGWCIALFGYLLKERPVQCTDNTSCQTGTVCRSTRPYFSHVTISVTVQLCVWIRLVIFVWITLKNILLKYGRLLLLKPVH